MEECPEHVPKRFEKGWSNQTKKRVSSAASSGSKLDTAKCWELQILPSSVCFPMGDVIGLRPRSCPRRPAATPGQNTAGGSTAGIVGLGSLSRVHRRDPPHCAVSLVGHCYCCPQKVPRTCTEFDAPRRSMARLRSPVLSPRSTRKHGVSTSSQLSTASACGGTYLRSPNTGWLTTLWATPSSSLDRVAALGS